LARECQGGEPYQIDRGLEEQRYGVLVVNYGRSTLRNQNSGWIRSTAPKHPNSGGLGFGN
jgi:hypothetical protein